MLAVLISDSSVVLGKSRIPLIAELLLIETRRWQRKRGHFGHSLMGLHQGSAASTVRIVTLNVIAGVKLHSRNVVQVGQEALRSQHLGLNVKQ